MLHDRERQQQLNEIMALEHKLATTKAAISAKKQRLVAIQRELAERDPHVTNHALLRLFERKFNFDIEALRREILELARDSIEAGKKEFEYEGVKFLIKGKVIATAWMSEESSRGGNGTTSGEDRD